jgi:uncharacterized coiled-coil protein SlyX
MLEFEKVKPRRIVINNIRKSIMAMGTSAALGLPAQQAPTVEQINQAIGAISENISSSNTPSMLNAEIARLTEQLAEYKEKNDQNLIKVRFLTDKLEAYGGMNEIPPQIVAEIS